MTFEFVASAGYKKRETSLPGFLFLHKLYFLIYRRFLIALVASS